jgi:imidazolonepropionase-like amidohydrolase
MHVQWPEFRASFSFRTGGLTPEEELEKTRKEEREAIDGLLRDARGYRIAVEAAGGAGKTGADFRRDQKLEAMLPVLEGAIPVIVHADNLRQIEDALAWGGKESLRIVIAGGYDAWRVADRLAKREVPVILGPIHRNPLRRHEAYDVPFTAPRKLHEAGVTFCIGGGGSRFTASSTRALPWGAATAAAYGLPREEALRSVTLYPARILGVEEHLGSIEAGKSASLIVTDGDPLEIRTQVKRVFIDGRESDLTNRHRTLYERYAARPPSAREVEGRKR